MRKNNRKPIERCRKKLPQFTTMNVIDGQSGLVIYSSLIFYSLTIDNILNITGSTSNTADIIRDNLKWQVLRIYDDGSMDLIGSPTSQNIYIILN